MAERDAFIPLDMNGERFHAHRGNTTLFTFFGEVAMFNHVFLQTGETEETAEGAYIFCDHPAYGPIAQFASEQDFPMVLNRLEVPQCDQDAWDNSHLGDIRGQDSFPDEWDE